MKSTYITSLWKAHIRFTFTHVWAIKLASKVLYGILKALIHKLHIFKHIEGFIQVKGPTRVRCVLKVLQELPILEVTKGFIWVKSFRFVKCVLNDFRNLPFLPDIKRYIQDKNLTHIKCVSKDFQKLCASEITKWYKQKKILTHLNPCHTRVASLQRSHSV